MMTNTILFINAMSTQESAIFVGDLTRMYLRWAEARGYEIEMLDAAESELGGFHKVSLIIGGESYERLRHEAGMHRKRFFTRESRSHQTHLATAHVRVAPDPDDLTINAEDVREDLFITGDGSTLLEPQDYPCVRLTHLPTGTVVNSMHGRSQWENRGTAMMMLRAWLRSEETLTSHDARVYDMVRDAATDLARYWVGT